MPRTYTFKVYIPGIGLVEKTVPSFDDIRELKELLKHATYALFDRSTYTWICQGVKDWNRFRELLRILGKENELDKFVNAIRSLAESLAREIGDRDVLIAVRPKYIEDPLVYKLVTRLRTVSKTIRDPALRTAVSIDFVVLTPSEFVNAVLSALGKTDPETLTEVLNSFSKALWIVYGDPDKFKEKVLKEASKPVKVVARFTPDGYVEIELPIKPDRSIIRALRNALMLEYNEQITDSVTGEIRLEKRTMYIGDVMETKNGIIVRIPPALLDYAVKKIEETVGVKLELPKELGIRFEKIELHPRIGKLRPYQEEALEAWMKNGCRGVIVLPTGAGKTIVALAAIARLRVPTLILVHTDALVEQWKEKIRELLGVEPGTLAKGKIDIKPITVATYQSAGKHADKLWNRFALLICDECHHEAARTFFDAVKRIAAPYRMGLTATPWREDQNEHLIFISLGPKVYEKSLAELVEEGWLAPVIVKTIGVPLPPELQERIRQLIRERHEYQMLGMGYHARGTSARISGEIMKNPEKIKVVVELVKKHLEQNPDTRIIVFTIYVPQAEAIYEALKKEIGEDKVAIFHGQMPTKKAEENLEKFRRGEAKVLVMTQKGEEGIDIPEASIGISVSGYTTPRQIIQRLGRIVRKNPKNPRKVAIFYIVYTEPYEERKVRTWLSMIESIAPQEVMKRLAERLQRGEVKKPEEKKEERRATETEKTTTSAKKPRRGKWLTEMTLEDLTKRIEEISPRLAELFRKAISKSPRKLSEAEKRVLLLARILVNIQSIAADIPQRSLHGVRNIVAWILSRSRGDIPGIDTPDARELYKKMKKLLKQKKYRELEKLVLGETVKA